LCDELHRIATIHIADKATVHRTPGSR
jgi:hypothetical protein